MVQNPLSRLKVKLNIALTDTSKDDLLSILLDDAKYYVLNFINDTEVPLLLNNVLVDIAAIQYNKLGNEGVKSYSEGGISVSYSDDIPKELINQMFKFRKLPKVMS